MVTLANPKTAPKQAPPAHKRAPRRGTGQRAGRAREGYRKIAAGASSTAFGGKHRTVRVAANASQTQATATVPPWKRGLDLTCIGIILPLILPLMVLLVLWIKLVSRGSALLRQTRIGRDGKPFVLYKFRSMQLNADPARHEAHIRGLVNSDRPMLKLDLIHDSRLIAGGRLMRTAGLDELPQLFNVLRGEMSIVGPRPCLPSEQAYFSPKQRERFQALPGLTGIWQVNGKNRATFREMNAMDIHYVRHASVMMDVQIMLRTPAALLVQMILAFQQRQVAFRRPAMATSGTQTGHDNPSRQHRQLL
jgi:lipopolysaccharide/colanic/teichoic acid biosynthesis glycosyltransferase